MTDAIFSPKRPPFNAKKAAAVMTTAFFDGLWGDFDYAIAGIAGDSAGKRDARGRVLFRW